MEYCAAVCACLVVFHVCSVVKSKGQKQGGGVENPCLRIGLSTPYILSFTFRFSIFPFLQVGKLHNLVYRG